MKCVTFFGSVGLLMAVGTFAARADIYQWEYVDPADPSQGKQQSTTLASDGAGVAAVPGADIQGRNLAMAYLVGADLRSAIGSYVNLTGADLSHANLSNASFNGATLSGAELTGASVRGTSFDIYYGPSTGLTVISREQLYSTASYLARDLTGIGLSGHDLSGWNFAGQNLSNANFTVATLAGADLTGAEIRGADFTSWVYVGGPNSFPPQIDPITRAAMTPAQLYSTASYQAGDLSGITLRYNELAGVNFAGQKLADANLSGANLAEADFRNASLANALFFGAALTNANFTGADVRGASFYDGASGFTLTQLYSTASYQAGDLTRIALPNFQLAGANLEGQKLANVDLRGANLIGASLRNASLVNGKFIREETGCYLFLCGSVFAPALLTGADLTSADARGSEILVPHAIDMFGHSPIVGADAIVTNLIHSDGHIKGFDLENGGLLIVRDYDGDPDLLVEPIPITVDEHLAAAPGGTLRMVFEADAWNSTISFAHGIPVTLGATLELTFAADVNLAKELGRTFHVFDWTGVEPGGEFDVSSPYAWDLSRLYATGEVTLIAVPEPSAGLLFPFALTAVLLMRGTNQLRFLRALQAAGSIVAILVCTAGTRADIYRWEYIDPADPSQGRQQSTTLAPDGADIDAVPGAYLSSRDLTMAYLVGADLVSGNVNASNLTNADMTWANFSSADLTQANLTNAIVVQATLTNSDFTGAEIKGARFGLCSPAGCQGTGISAAQLYSTASYRAHDLRGISLGAHSFVGGQFERQDLQYADFGGADLTEANFREANLANVSLFGFRRSCRPLAGCNYANLAHATLTDVDFTGADIRGAILSADALSNTITNNLILPDGHVNGLDLDAGNRLVVRNYDGDSRFEPAKPPIPITVDEQLAMDSGGTLRMVFDANAWNSTISFAPGIPVKLGGTLEFAFADDVNVTSQVGRTLKVFDWTGVTPTGAFAVASSYRWDLANLYTTGEVTLIAVPELSGLTLASLAAFGITLHCTRRIR